MHPATNLKQIQKPNFWSTENKVVMISFGERDFGQKLNPYVKPAAAGICQVRGHHPHGVGLLLIEHAPPAGVLSYSELITSPSPLPDDSVNVRHGSKINDHEAWSWRTSQKK